MSSENPWNVVFVLGPPGSGKGTQCTRIQENFGFKHLSAGDLLRAERSDPSSEFGKLIDDHIKNGTIVPVEITCALLENAMKASGSPPGFLIDGFPRNENNLDGWTKAMCYKTKTAFVLYIECPVETCVSRCLDRGKTSGRADDNEESLKKRVDTYNNQTFPIIQKYDALSLVRKVDGSASADHVFETVCEIFKNAKFDRKQ